MRILLSLSALFLAAMFLWSFLAASVFADVNLPFDRTDSGLDIIPQGEDIVVEGAPDTGANQLVDIMVTVFHTLKWLLGFIVFGWIVYAGVYLVSSSVSEDSYTSATKMVMYAIVGLVVMLLSEPFILDILYGGGNRGVNYDASLAEKMLAGTQNFRIQLDGVLAFFKTLLVFIAMAYVIIAGVRMILAFGQDEAISSARAMFLPIIFGIIVIVFNEVFIDYVLYDISFDGDQVNFSPESSEVSVFVEQIVGFIQYILQFLALIIFGFLVYGGFLYVISFGNEEGAEKGRKIFINAFIAMVIIILSYILMWSLVNFSLTDVA